MVTSIVAGGASFFGSHLVDALAQRDEAVVVLDDLGTGRIGNLESAISSGRVTFVYVDTAVSAVVLREVILSSGAKSVDRIFDLAFAPRPHVTDGRGSLPAEGLQTGSLIELALEMGAALVFASSPCAPGDGRAFSSGNESTCDDAQLVGEAAVTAAARGRGLDARIVRLLNCYGPRIHSEDDALLTMLFDAALHGRPMPIEGIGEQSRTMTFVDDAVERMLTVATWPAGRSVPVRVTETQELSVFQIARAVAQTAGIEFAVDAVALGSVAPPPRRLLDVRGSIAFSATRSTPLEEGLRRTYDWFAKEHQLFV